MRKNRREMIAVLAGAAVVPAVSPIAFAPTASAQTSGALSPEEARAIAKEVFLWGMHPVAIYHLRYLHVQNDKSPVCPASSDVGASDRRPRHDEHYHEA